jgi:hypothetical protein
VSHHDARRYAETTLADARAIGVVGVDDGMVITGEGAILGMIGSAHQDGQTAARAESGPVAAAEETVTYTVDLPHATPTGARAYDEESGAPARGSYYATEAAGDRVAIWDLGDPDDAAMVLDVEDAEALIPLLARLVVDHQWRQRRRREDAIDAMSAGIHAARHTDATPQSGRRCAACGPIAEAAYDALTATHGGQG